MTSVILLFLVLLLWNIRLSKGFVFKIFSHHFFENLTSYYLSYLLRAFIQNLLNDFFCKYFLGYLYLEIFFRDFFNITRNLHKAGLQGGSRQLNKDHMSEKKISMMTVQFATSWLNRTFEVVHRFNGRIKLTILTEGWNGPKFHISRPSEILTVALPYLLANTIKTFHKLDLSYGFKLCRKVSWNMGLIQNDRMNGIECLLLGLH